MGIRIFTRKFQLLFCNYPLIKGRCLVLVSSSVFRYPYSSFFFCNFVLLNTMPVNWLFSEQEPSHLRCSPWSFDPAVTLNVALPVEFSFFYFSHVYLFPGPTGFFLFSTFSIFSRTRFFFYTFLYIRIELLLRKDEILCLLSVPPQIPKDKNFRLFERLSRACVWVMALQLTFFEK